MGARWRRQVALAGLAALGCGARSGLLLDESATAPVVDAAKPKSDPCAMYSHDAAECERHIMCAWFECGTGPADADIKPTAFACMTSTAPIPNLCP